MFNIYIRKLSINDASISCHWRNNPEIWHFTDHKPDKFITEDIERSWLAEKLTEKNSSRFAIIVDTKYIGNIQITDIEEQDRGQYHIFIGEKPFWGKGVAKEATAQIIRFAKEKLNLKQLYLKVNPKNVSAIKLYEKCGFIKVNDDIQMNLNLSDINPPMVSVFVMTYNHEQFIAKALYGILMQKSNFDFEIVVGEDGSVDNTRKIILDITENYPGKFKLILHESNIGAMANQFSVQSACTGKYVAICEGDDYWTNPDKIQKQVDFLENHEEYSMCFHESDVVNAKNDFLWKFNNIKEDRDFSLADLIKRNFISTASVVFRRKNIQKIPDLFYQLNAGDWGLHLINARNGKIRYFKDCMSAYRQHGGGMWASLSNNEMVLKGVELMEQLDVLFNLEYHEQFKVGIEERLKNLKFGNDTTNISFLKKVKLKIRLPRIFKRSLNE